MKKATKSQIRAVTDEKPEWEQLELVIWEIQKQLAPDGEVRHNHRIKGKSGRRRKLDLTITQRVSVYPIFIVFDCKHHKRPVKMKDVEAFAGQLKDVKASLGVMISDSAFDAGAKAIAAENNIILQTFRKAQDTDWKALVGQEAWVFLTYVSIPNVEAFAVLRHRSEPVKIPFNVLILDQEGVVQNNLKDLFWEIWKHPNSPRLIGELKVHVTGDIEPFFISIGGRLIQTDAFDVRAKLIAKKYAVNLNLAAGRVLEDFDTGTPVYSELNSRGFDWADIIRGQEGVEMTPEEYVQSLRESPVVADLSNAKKWLRLVVNENRGPKPTI